MDLKSRGIAWKGGGNERYDIARKPNNSVVIEDEEEISRCNQSWLKVGDSCAGDNSSHSATVISGLRFRSIGSRVASLIFILLVACVVDIGASDSEHKNQNYHMASLCKNHYLQQMYRKIDGAVLWSQNERNLDCVVTFQTHSILQRFMLRFDMLQLDCNDHLYIYDGSHAVGTHKADLTCRNTKQSVGAIYTRTNFVTLKYVTDGWGTDSNGFKMVITAVKDPKHACKDFRCTLAAFCIHPNLVCDGVNHCADGSDEAIGTLCQSQDPTRFLGLDLTWFVLIAVSGLLVVCACIVGIAICVCRRGTSTHHGNNMQLHPGVETNGSSKYLHGSLQRDNHMLHQTSIPASGNCHHPAGPTSGTDNEWSSPRRVIVKRRFMCPNLLANSISWMMC